MLAALARVNGCAWRTAEYDGVNGYVPAGSLMVSDGFVRIAIYRDGKRTSVSLDDVLFSALCARQGGAEAAAQWVREAADRVPQLREAADPVVLVDRPGLSRLVQRLAMAYLIPGIPAAGEEIASGWNASDGEADGALNTGLSTVDVDS